MLEKKEKPPCRKNACTGAFVLSSFEFEHGGFDQVVDAGKVDLQALLLQKFQNESLLFLTHTRFPIDLFGYHNRYLSSCRVMLRIWGSAPNPEV